MGWQWQYEPLDLNGYIPDFILLFHKPMLVEVKPELYLKDLHKHCKRIEDSGWDSEALIVGTDTFSSNCGDAAIGIVCEHVKPASGLGAHWWSTALFHVCRKCKSWSFHHEDGGWNCRVSGCASGDHYIDNVDPEKLRRLFAEASRVVQYNAA